MSDNDSKVKRINNDEKQTERSSERSKGAGGDYVICNGFLGGAPVVIMMLSPTGSAPFATSDPHEPWTTGNPCNAMRKAVPGWRYGDEWNWENSRQVCVRVCALLRRCAEHARVLTVGKMFMSEGGQTEAVCRPSAFALQVY